MVNSIKLLTRRHGETAVVWRRVHVYIVYTRVSVENSIANVSRRLINSSILTRAKASKYLAHVVHLILLLSLSSRASYEVQERHISLGAHMRAVLRPQKRAHISKWLYVTKAMFRSHGPIWSGRQIARAFPCAARRKKRRKNTFFDYRKSSSWV